VDPSSRPYWRQLAAWRTWGAQEPSTSASNGTKAGDGAGSSKGPAEGGGVGEEGGGEGKEGAGEGNYSGQRRRRGRLGWLASRSCGGGEQHAQLRLFFSSDPGLLLGANTDGQQLWSHPRCQAPLAAKKHQ